MKKIIPFFFLNIFVTITAFPITVSTPDSLALVDIYNQNNGASWTNKANWLTGPVGTWHGIDTQGGNRVKIINLTNNGLTGAFSSSIGNFSELIELGLSYNTITNLPSAICTIPTLQLLYGSNNELLALPDLIGSLTNLEQITAEDNPITSIPVSIANLTKLFYLNLGENDISIIPSQIGFLTELTTLDLSSNNISIIPTEIGSLT